MKKMLFPFLVAFVLVLSACNMTVLSGSGNIISSNRPVSGFTRLVFDAPGELTLTQNGKETLTIEGDDNLLSHIKSKVKNGALHIYLEPATFQIIPTQPIQYSLSVKDLEQVSLDGSGTIYAADFKTDQFTLKLNGSGDILFDTLNVKMLDFGMNGSGSLKLDQLTAQNVTFDLIGSGNVTVNALNADRLQASVSGSGNYLLKGQVAQQNVRTLGSGDYDARSLQSAQAEVSIAGSGDSQVWVTETVSISILGSGDVGYVGKPKITQTIAGSGSVYPLE